MEELTKEQIERAIREGVQEGVERALGPVDAKARQHIAEIEERRGKRRPVTHG